MTQLEYGNLSLDLPTLNTEFMSRVHNAVPQARGYGPLKTLSGVSPALDNACLGATSVVKNDGVPYNYAGDSAKLYEVSETAATDRSKGGGYTLADTEGWEFVKFGENIIAVSIGENPQTMTIGGANFADLGGTPPKASTAAAVRDFVVLGDIDDGTAYPSRLHWSAFNDSTGWTAGTNQSDTQDLFGNDGKIMRIIGGEFGTIFKERSIWRMTFEGPPTVFRFDKVQLERGTIAKWSVVSVDSNIFYLSNDGFFVFDGNESLPIGEGQVDQYFFDTVYKADMWKVHGVSDPVNKRIIWVYPTSEADPDAALIFDYRNNKWATAEITSQFLFPGQGGGVTLDTLDTISSSLDAFAGSLDDTALIAGDYALAGFDGSNKFGFFNGADAAAIFETPMMQLNETGTSIITAVRALADADPTIQIGTADRLNATITWTPETDINSIGEANFLSDARYHIIRANYSASSGFTNAYGVIFEGRPTGFR